LHQPADTFAVSASTAAFGGRAEATAQSLLTFSPLADGSAPVSFDFVGSGMSIFSDGYVRLFDLTANRSMFHYSWVGIGGDTGLPRGTNIPSFDITRGGFLSLDTALLDSHDYALTMHVATNSSSDSAGFRISMAGLAFTPVVPEPETWAMMLVGLAGVLFASRSKQRRAASQNDAGGAIAPRVIAG
jgi:hypothetical protein